MASAAVTATRSVARAGSGYARFVVLSVAHAAVIVLVPHPIVIALLLWWNANTISHNFIHRPFFAQPAANRAYAFALSLLLGIPQTLWRDRHLLHHAGDDRRAGLRAASRAELAGIAVLWTALGLVSPAFFFWAYLPGWALGLGLCYLQGHYEHAGGTTSHYGRIYNVLFFNDGYHVEHHRDPSAAWMDLRQSVAPNARQSKWPPVLRWLDRLGAVPFPQRVLETLERIVLRSPALQRAVVAAHQRALRALAREALATFDVRSITVVGGGLFPRSAIVARKIWPDAAITAIDADAAHLDAARPLLPAGVATECRQFVAGDESADLVIIPLAFVGSRDDLYARPPASAVVIHDWIWRRRARGVIVSWWLLKRINLVVR